ncbi:MAG TPA: SDR family NAD(P)-dependent oxidoreductase [Thermoanaerobaculia bacterium]|nr:SDR family NAD(P)-dependent oxidoreductase [Thermoanaerobaculia bacterium]
MAVALFRDAVAVVTGGASGLGRALCEELGRRGARVVVTDVQEAGARAVADGIVAAGGRATAAGLDVRDAAAFERLLDDTAASHGRLDYLFNNAGLSAAGEARNLALDHWRKVLDVNLWGVIHGASAAYARMARQGSGHIVNIASLAGLVSMALGAPYTASKFGVVGLSLTMRAEGADLGIKVSAVCPAYIRTGIFDNGTYVEADKQGILAVIPFKFLEVDAAARTILQGVERNKAVLVFPFYARMLWWLTRLSPSIAVSINRKTSQAFRRRAARKQTAG